MKYEGSIVLTSYQGWHEQQHSTYIEEILLAEWPFERLVIRKEQLELRNAYDLLHHGLGRQLAEEGHAHHLHLAHLEDLCMVWGITTQ